MWTAATQWSKRSENFIDLQRKTRQHSAEIECIIRAQARNLTTLEDVD